MKRSDTSGVNVGFRIVDDNAALEVAGLRIISHFQEVAAGALVFELAKLTQWAAGAVESCRILDRRLTKPNGVPAVVSHIQYAASIQCDRIRLIKFGKRSGPIAQPRG